MSFFHQPRPKAFHHVFIYANEHKARVHNAKQNAQRVSGKNLEESKKDVQRVFSDMRKKQSRQRGEKKFMSWMPMFFLLVLLLMFIFFLSILLK